MSKAPADLSWGLPSAGVREQAHRRPRRGSHQLAAQYQRRVAFPATGRLGRSPADRQ